MNSLLISIHNSEEQYVLFSNVSSMLKLSGNKQKIAAGAFEVSVVMSSVRPENEQEIKSINALELQFYQGALIGFICTPLSCVGCDVDHLDHLHQYFQLCDICLKKRTESDNIKFFMLALFIILFYCDATYILMSN